MRTTTLNLLVLVFTLSLAASGWSVATAASLETYAFDDPRKEALFHELIDELRCPKCQNQSIAESDAPLAKDLRDRTYIMLQNGASKQEVINYMVARYGDFVHYQPPWQISTSILWWGPVGIILIGLLVVFIRARARVEPDELTVEEEQQLARLRRTDKEQD
ncbi:cystathionine gamma-synthase [Pseudidiomarina salinarum]|uniref:Cytochrome c-type biogenesis protein n=1 Tax=Pseudidiomarina salinarum TaxID=435908 RepID=A0A094IWD8_9GAMM|nr:cytochrome c-type biogenesis protein [Pseudidiomarina salinarum]KFZ31407.1 cystathionine gamma-synthase [Pseudidiomarina salinarum]RUO70833.1 cytochrome c-type biogenesis protein CcmH [Pseudidiomarina salinarum]